MSSSFTKSWFNLLTFLKNAYLTRRSFIRVPKSSVNFKILRFLLSLNLISYFHAQAKFFVVFLNYGSYGEPAFRNVRGFRKSTKHMDFKEVGYLTNTGELLIIRTSIGIVTGDVAYRNKLGGRVICVIKL